jgi:hypothetical protein
MIYELRNKVPQASSFVYSEDVLTGTIFGNLRYFSTQELLIDFLNQSNNLDNTYLALNKNNTYSIYFWEKYYNSNNNKINEPDLVLLNNENIIIIECKYFSFLNEEGDIVNGREKYNNQLLRYSSIIEDYYGTKKNKILIFLTNDKTKPLDLLTKTIEKINPEIKLYWLSWMKLYRCIKNHDRNLLNTGEKLLCDDLIKFLEKRNLTGFYGFEYADILSESFYHKKYCFSKISFQSVNWRFRE